MKDTAETGGPAFPLHIASPPGSGGGAHSYYGMTLRDWFAGQAVMGLIASNDAEAGDRIEDVPAYAYQIADAMLKARAKTD